jgi:RNA polymerase sigma factor (sigma-70 family)
MSERRELPIRRSRSEPGRVFVELSKKGDKQHDGRSRRAGCQTRTVHGDIDTVERFCSGDEQAVREVYQRYGRLVFTVAMRVLADRHLAEDATQQTFLQAWRAASEFDSSRDLAPWLATIARRVAIDMQRRSARRPATSIETADASNPALVSLPPSPEAIWETWQVRTAIDELEPGERDIVRLQHLDGFTHSEIAERLGMPVGTVKSRSFRAHTRLATRLRHLRDPIGEAEGTLP